MKGTPVLRHKLLLPLFVLALALGLAACGSSESDEDKIIDVIETSATSSDPSNCTELQTTTFNEQNTQESGDAATKGCEKEAKEDDEETAESVEVSEVKVDGDTATATAALTGGDLDAQTVELELVKDGDDWKLNEITGFVDFDAAKVIAMLAEGFEEEESIEPALASCIVETLEESSDSEVEELILNTSDEGFVGLVEACQE
jgi:ABC-type glycerol-3-phosphate transport system substrate-binding protein